jgi:hypothetical protein
MTISSFVGGAGSPCLHSGSNQREGAEMNQLELMAAGERPIVKVTILDVKENFDIAHFDEPELDSAVSCLSAKYHNIEGEIQSDPDDELQWHLPGWGKPKDDCGDYLKAVGCPGHGTPTLTGANHTRKIILKHCHNPECPICYVPWAVRDGNRAAERMRNAEALYRRAGNDLQEPRHFTFSPPQEAAKLLMKTDKGSKQLKKFTLRLVKKAGIVGGAIIFHSHRLNKYKQLYLSPHFHVVGYGYVQETKKFRKACDGWIYKNMGVRASLAGTLIYALDHCGLAYKNGERVGHALIWFGALSYNKIAKDSIVIEEKAVKCSACPEELLEYELAVKPDGHGMEADWNTVKGDYRIKVKTILYKLVWRKPKKNRIKETEFKRFERLP